MPDLGIPDLEFPSPPPASEGWVLIFTPGRRFSTWHYAANGALRSLCNRVEIHAGAKRIPGGDDDLGNCAICLRKKRA
jgi:hypothetical protein